MLVAVVALLLALAVGGALGGRLGALGRLSLRSRRLVPAALLAQLAGTLSGGPLYPAGLAASAVLVGVFLLRNRGLRGTGLVAAGLLLNALVVGANGAMPVSAAAAGRAGLTAHDAAGARDARHEPLDQRTRLRLLADVVPVPLPLWPQVVSPGDLLVAGGLARLVVLGMGPGRYRARRVRDRPAVRSWSSTRVPHGRTVMAKKSRKRRARKKSSANHGKRPNA